MTWSKNKKKYVWKEKIESWLKSPLFANYSRFQHLDHPLLILPNFLLLFNY